MYIGKFRRLEHDFLRQRHKRQRICIHQLVHKRPRLKRKFYAPLLPFQRYLPFRNWTHIQYVRLAHGLHRGARELAELAVREFEDCARIKQ